MKKFKVTLRAVLEKPEDVFVEAETMTFDDNWLLFTGEDKKLVAVFNYNKVVGAVEVNEKGKWIPFGEDPNKRPEPTPHTDY